MTVYVMSLRVDTASSALPAETDGETLSRLLFEIAGHVQGLSSPVIVGNKVRPNPLAEASLRWTLYPEDRPEPVLLTPDPPENRKVIITRRENFERMERLEILRIDGPMTGSGPMIAVPDFTDHESEDWLPEGVDLKTFANNLARMDPAVVGVRPADPYHRKNRP